MNYALIQNVENYRPISVLLCFLKALEIIMYDRLYLYLNENDLIYNKQFGFQKRQPTNHAIVQLTDQIQDIFNKKI